MKKRVLLIFACLFALLLVTESITTVFSIEPVIQHNNGTIEQQEKEQPPFVHNCMALLSVSGLNSGTGHFFEGKNQHTATSIPHCLKKGLHFLSSFSFLQSHFFALQHHYKLLFPFHSFW